MIWFRWGAAAPVVAAVTGNVAPVVPVPAPGTSVAQAPAPSATAAEAPQVWILSLANADKLTKATQDATVFTKATKALFNVPTGHVRLFRGRVIVTGSDDKTIRVWQASDGAALATLRVPIAAGDEGSIYAVAISPDGRTLLAGGSTGLVWDRAFAIYIFDLETGRLKGRLPTEHNHNQSARFKIAADDARPFPIVAIEAGR